MSSTTRSAITRQRHFTHAGNALRRHLLAVCHEHGCYNHATMREARPILTIWDLARWDAMGAHSESVGAAGGVFASEVAR